MFLKKGVDSSPIDRDKRPKDYGTKPPPHDLKAEGHCERSEAIFARKQRLLGPLPLFAMTVLPPGFFSIARVCLTVLSPLRSSYSPLITDCEMLSIRQNGDAADRPWAAQVVSEADFGIFHLTSAGFVPQMLANLIDHANPSRADRMTKRFEST